MTVKRRKLTYRAKKRIFMFLFLMIFIFTFLEFRIRPVIESAASVQAKSIAVLAINQTVLNIIDETGLSCEDLESITVNENHIITAISTNTIRTNQFKNMITLRVQEELCNIKNKEINIPVGNIIGGELLNGRGPEIPVYISMTGTVSSEFESKLESGGINQTVHQLSVNISAEITVLMPMTSVHETVSTSVLIGETVIVGTTPSGMIMR